MQWSEEQVEAIDLAVDPRNRIVGITGEAGSGKTTLLSEVYNQLSEVGLTGLAAPTGRAAKRITEATGIPAKTIHRMMRYSMPEDDEEHGLPAHDKNNPLPYKFVLVDEASMVNDDLYRAVIDALPPGVVYVSLEMLISYLLYKASLPF
jgi:exodeoxyribonuclease V alpha subunit